MLMKQNKTKQNNTGTHPPPRNNLLLLLLIPSQQNLRKPSNIPRSNHLPSLPKPHDWDSNTPRISRRPSVRQPLALDRKVQRNVQRARLKEPKSHAIQILSWQPRDVSRNLIDESQPIIPTPLRPTDHHKTMRTITLTTAAANSGNTSMQFKCAPRARTRWFQVAAGSLGFQVSRFVRGMALEEVLEVRCMRRAVT
jgi:hypothetical protein